MADIYPQMNNSSGNLPLLFCMPKKSFLSAVRPKGERPSLDGEDQLRGAGGLAVHRGGAGADAHRAPPLGEDAFQLQHVAGDDLPLEAGVFHPAEEGNFPLIFR